MPTIKYFINILKYHENVMFNALLLMLQFCSILIKLLQLLNFILPTLFHYFSYKHLLLDPQDKRGAPHSGPS